MKKIFIKKLFLTLFLFSSSTIGAHPHVFLEALIRPVIQEDKLLGIKYIGIIDELNSLIYINAYDEDMDGNLDKEEGKRFIEDTFGGFKGNLSHFHVRLDQESIEIGEVEIEKVHIHDVNLIYEVYLPINKTIDSIEIMSLSVYDPEYYFDYIYYEEYLLSNMIDREFYFDLRENNQITYYMGNMYPIEFEVYFE